MDAAQNIPDNDQLLIFTENENIVINEAFDTQFNPYQYIYANWVAGELLNDESARKVREQFIDPRNRSDISDTRKGKKYSKSYLWASVFSSGGNCDFF
ncbi:MAG: hypothetical protein HEEMFOPI_02030 [Holosporales bacterium]